MWIPEAAKETGLSESTLRKYCQRGDLAGEIRLNKERKFPRSEYWIEPSEIKKYLDKHSPKIDPEIEIRLIKRLNAFYRFCTDYGIDQNTAMKIAEHIKPLSILEQTALENPMQIVALNNTIKNPGKRLPSS